MFNSGGKTTLPIILERNLHQSENHNT